MRALTPPRTDPNLRRGSGRPWETFGRPWESFGRVKGEPGRPWESFGEVKEDVMT